MNHMTSGTVACLLLEGRLAPSWLTACRYLNDRSDGVWDTLDAVQNGTPRHFGLPHDTWEGLTPAEFNRIVPLVSDVTKEASASALHRVCLASKALPPLLAKQ